MIVVFFVKTNRDYMVILGADGLKSDIKTAILAKNSLCDNRGRSNWGGDIIKTALYL